MHEHTHRTRSHDALHCAGLVGFSTCKSMTEQLIPTCTTTEFGAAALPPPPPLVAPVLVDEAGTEVGEAADVRAVSLGKRTLFPGEAPPWFGSSALADSRGRSSEGEAGRST